jgi:antitoxin HicB
MKAPRFEDYEFEIRRIAEEDGGGYSITFPDLPGCRSDGETLNEAEENGKDAFCVWMDAWVAEGREIPKPGARDESPAKFLQRVPKYVHVELMDVARQQGVSLNTLVTGFIVAGLERINVSQAAPAARQSRIPYFNTHMIETRKAGVAMASTGEGRAVIGRWDRRDTESFAASIVPRRRSAHG